MKICRNALFSLSAFLLSLLLIINPLGIGKLSVDRVQAQSASRPYVILVNGNADCCVWSGTGSLQMSELWNIPNADFRMTAWDHFQDRGRQRRNINIGVLGSYSASNDRDFINQASDFINNQLDQSRPLIIIGHSYGGDSVLKLAHRISRRIQFLGVIDPVGAGGFRTPIRNHGVPPNVDYFFNRWQENAFATDNIVPFDSRGSGSINGCRARTCDQQAQNLARNADGSEIRVSCGAEEFTCEGWRLPGCNLGGCWSGSNGTKAKRLTHNPMPSDAYIQRQILDRISSILANFRLSATSTSQGFQLGFYRQGNQPEVYLVFRSNGRHCHVQNSDQMNSFGGFGQVSSLQNLTFTNSSGGFSGACGFPNGFYRLGNQAEVYRLYGGGIPEFNIGGSYCHVANSQQMEAFGGFKQVRSIATNSDLGRGREFTGTCQNP